MKVISSDRVRNPMHGKEVFHIKTFEAPLVPFKLGSLCVKEGQGQEEQWKTTRISFKKAKTCARQIKDRSPIFGKTLILTNTPSQKEKEGIKCFNHFSELREDDRGSASIMKHNMQH